MPSLTLVDRCTVEWFLQHCSLTAFENISATRLKKNMNPCFAVVILIDTILAVVLNRFRQEFL